MGRTIVGEWVVFTWVGAKCTDRGSVWVDMSKVEFVVGVVAKVALSPVFSLASVVELPPGGRVHSGGLDHSTPGGAVCQGFVS